jgi:hypothetical protein
MRALDPTLAKAIAMKVSPEAPIPDWSGLETAFEHNAPITTRTST